MALKVIREWLEIPSGLSWEEAIEELNRIIRVLSDAIDAIGAFVLWGEEAEEYSPTTDLVEHATSTGNPHDTNFTDLDDTPSSYSGHANKAVVVKATEDGVEFASTVTPSVHGNEAHNPDFLAVDGSNSPTAAIDWDGKDLTNVGNLQTANAQVDNQLTDGTNSTTVQEVRSHIDADVPASSPHGIQPVDPSSTDTTKNKVLSNSLAKGWEDHKNTTSGNPHGVDFVELDDAPSDYTGQAGKAVVVKSTEDGVEFSNPAPAAHGPSHELNGSDQIDVRGLQGGWLTADTEANRPAAGTKDRYFYATDTGKLYYDDGTSWIEITPTPASHAPSHQPEGSDALPTAIPGNITEGATASEGTSTSFARADHVHGTPSEWTPKVHGNEAHDPSFLALDGSTEMSGHFKMDYQKGWIYKALAGVTDKHFLGYYGKFIFLPANNDWQDLDLTGEATITITPSAFDTAKAKRKLFDGTGSTFILPQDTDFPLTITVDYSPGTAPNLGDGTYTFVVSMYSGRYCQYMKVEAMHPDYDGGAWQVAGELTGNTQEILVLGPLGVYSLLGNHHPQKIRITLDQPVTTGYHYIKDVYCLRGNRAAFDRRYLKVATSDAINAYISYNKWLSVATSGIVGLPRPSYVYAYMDNGGANYSVSATTWTKVPFDTVVMDVQSEFDTTNNRFTATEDGKYLCIVKINIDNVTDQNYYYVKLYKNGSALPPYGILRPSGSLSSTLLLCSVVNCNAGDYLECWVYGQTAFDILSGEDNSDVWFVKVA